MRIKMALVILGLTIGNFQATAAEPQFHSHLDVTYSTVQGEKLKLDLLVPKGKGPFPCVICFHGGAWMIGSRKDLSKPSYYPSDSKEESLLESLVKKGFAAASVSYRLAPKHKFPAQIIDAKTAVRFLRSHAEKYRLDPDRFAAMGFSAGGHLAALLGTAINCQEFETKEHGTVTSKVQCVVDYFGPTQLDLYAESEILEQKYMKPFLGKAFSENSKLYKQASPLSYVSKDSCPFLILHGTIDLIVPVIHSEKFAQRLKENEIDVKLVKYPWKGHGWLDNDTLQKSQKETIQFLQKYLMKAPANK